MAHSSRERVTSERGAGRTYRGPIIDVDIHQCWTSEDELIPYLSPEWRNYLRLSGRGHYPLSPASTLYPPLFGLNKRLDTFPATGGPPGSDLDTMRHQLLDAFNVVRGVLTYDVTPVATIRNPYFAVDAARAANDWCLDRWLSADSRLYGAIMVPTEMPDRAAAEIRRLAGNPRMVEVILLVSALGKPFGHPVYDPIYEAAAEVGLPVAIHVGGEQWGYAQTAAGGLPSTRLEFHTLTVQPMLHHLISFITHGVFEKYPNLRLMMVEIGVTWLPWFLWKLDSLYPILRMESPWIKRLPSEYIREHVRFSTQPLEMSPDRLQLIDLLEAVEGAEDLLCFATDYPHWDADDPHYIASRLPSEWLSKIFFENACAFYGWPAKELTAQNDRSARRQEVT